jgi:sulfide:quinone oxidoreductase
MTERIVIVGGGTGGTVLANRLADKLADEIDAGDAEVVLVNETEDHVYKPVFLYVAFGKREAADARRPLRDLLDPRVTLRTDRVTDIDTEGKTVSLRDDGGDLSYDHLVVATGARVTPDETPGLVEAGHQFYNAEGAERLREELADFEEGHLVLSVIGTPHMCPAAPLEFVLMADEWLRELGRREDVEITYTYPINRVHGVQSIADWAKPRFEERGINYETFFNVDEIDAENKVLHTMEGSEMEFDLLVAIPEHKGDQLVIDAGLGDQGWIAVDKETLEATEAEDVYAIGDTADIPTSKAGSVAHYAAGVVADRLAAKVRGHVPTARFDGKTMCFIEAGMDSATYVSFDYENAPVVRDESKYVHWAKLAYNESYWLTARGLL